MDQLTTAADDQRALNALLDKLRDDSGYSDREMSVMTFGLSPGAVSQWRTGRSLPDDERAALLADKLRLNRAYVVAIINRQRAKSAVLREMWTMIAEQFKNAAVLAIVSAAPFLAAPSPAQAAISHNHFADYTLRKKPRRWCDGIAP